MADEQNWTPRQLTDSELNREIADHHQLLQQPLSPLQRDDVETALRTFVLQRDQRHTARRAAALRLAAGTVIMHPAPVAGPDADTVRAAFPG